MPRSATRLPQYGWSAHWGTTTWGAPARVAVVVVPAPPWCTTAATRPNSACWFTSPPVKQSSRSSRGAGPAAGDERAAALPADRLDGHPGDVLWGAHAAEAHVHRWRAGVQERLQFGREPAFVGQDPRAGLHHVEVGRLLPGSQGRVR